MAEYSEEKRQLLKQFSQNLQIISALYPNASYSISQLAEQIKWDQGSLSKAVNSLIDSGLLIQKDEVKGKGKPQKIVGLSEISFRLFSLVNDYLGKKLVEGKYSDPRVLDEYFDMLDSNDEQMMKIALDGLSAESTKKIYPDDNYLKQLGDKIFNSNKNYYKEKLIHIILNIAKISKETKLRTLDELYREDLLKTFYAEGEKTEQTEAVRIVVLKILAETVEPSEKYGILRDAYIKLIREGSRYTSAARDTFISKFSDKIPDLKLDLIKVARESDSRVKGLISEELKNLF
jgi:DNA-binding MarR family transcriptional regulator